MAQGNSLEKELYADIWDDLPLVPGPITAPGAPAAARSGLDKLQAEIGSCTRCTLHVARQKVVHGEGHFKPRLLVVAPPPSRADDLSGKPLSGAPGELLTKMLQAISEQRENVRVVPVVRCHPPLDRAPHPPELDACENFLSREIALLAPICILALGTAAAQAVLRTDVALEQVRGRDFTHEGIPVVCSYAPAELLEQPQKKRGAWDDLKRVQAILNAPV